MSELLGQAKEKALAWWMMGVWFFLFTFAALGNAIIMAFYGMRWVDMEQQDRIMVGILIFVNWSTVMMAFFSKAVSRVSKGELPIAEGDTQLFQRAGTVTSTKHETKVERFEPATIPEDETRILKKIEGNTAATAANTAEAVKTP